MSEKIVEKTEDIEEIKTEPVETLNYEEISANLYKQLQEYQFFSDQVKVNATLFQGFNIILEKLTKIEEKLNGNKG
jgi:hypothetical protein